MFEVPARGWIIAAVVGLLVGAFLSLRSIRRRELREVSKFRSKAEHTDEAFISELGLTIGSEEAAAALALRRALAEFGEVPPESLKASTRFHPDLERLPFYDSLDAVEMALAAEELLGIELSDEELSIYFGPEVLKEATIGSLISSVLAHAKRSRTANASHDRANVGS